MSYLARTIERKELRDTLWLLPRENRLDEVVVWGTDRKNIMSMVASATADAPAYAPAPGIVTFDFFEMIRKKPLSKKARKKNKQLLENWDKIYNNAIKWEEENLFLWRIGFKGVKEIFEGVKELRSLGV